MQRIVVSLGRLTRSAILALCTALVLASCSTASDNSESDASTKISESTSAQTESTESAVNNPRVVYLTYDDGPADDTAALLKVLAKHGAQATFFVVGEMVSRNTSTLTQIHDGGHFIGNHTWNHPELDKLSSAQVRSELTRTQEVSDLIGNCYRPPYGLADKKVDKVASELGLKKILWDVVTGDWDPLTVAQIKAKILAAEPGDNILMHDGPASRQNTVKATDEALKVLKERGFDFKGVPACAPR